MSGKLVRTLEAWTLQYVVLMPVLVALHMFGPSDHHHGGEGDDHGEGGGSAMSFYLHWGSQIVFMTSTTFSLSALIGFYHTFSAEIAQHSPFAKLICIKLVVALCFWQSLIVPLVGAHFELSAAYQDEINDVLIIVEMGLIFSFAFCIAYWLHAVATPAAAAAAAAEKGKEKGKKKEKGKGTKK